MRQEIKTDRAAAPKGPYSQGIVCEGRQLYVAGQVPADPVTGEFVGTTFEEQAIQTFENLKAVIEAAGGTLEDVVKVNAYIADMNDFPKFNEIYQRYFKPPYPTRATVPASFSGFMLEVDCIAVLQA